MAEDNYICLFSKFSTALYVSLFFIYWQSNLKYWFFYTLICSVFYVIMLLPAGFALVSAQNKHKM